MKTKRLLSIYLILTLLLLGSGVAINAQENAGDFYVISGIVKDLRTKKPVEYVMPSAISNPYR